MGKLAESSKFCYMERAETVLPTPPGPNHEADKRDMADKPNTIILSYRYRLLPTKGQHRRLREALEHSRQLYNAALQERIDCYRKTGKGLTFFKQCRGLTQLRETKEFTRFPLVMQRFTLQQVDRAYKHFFKFGGFPRFKGRDWYKTIGWNQCDGWRLRNDLFIAKGIGAIKILFSRNLPSYPSGCRIKREGRHWYISFTCEVECTAANDNPAIGIDMGISSLAAMSNGDLIGNARPYLRAQKTLRVKARALARCKRGSKRRRKVKEALANTHRAVRQARDTYLHQVSADIVSRFGLIAIEALNVKGLAKSTLAKHVNDASWGKFISFLRYKAERAGSRLIEVDPRHTSQTCPECGTVKPKDLSERVHKCDCGCVLDRDVAAAKVVLHRAVHGSGVANVGGFAGRSPRKAVA